MISTAPISLEGPSVRLEPLKATHHGVLTAIGLHPELWRVQLDRLATADDVNAYIARAMEAQKAGTALPFVTRDKATGEIVGCTRFMNIDAHNRRVEIGGTWLNPGWQRTHINTEAKYLMLCHAFERWNCVRVELKTDALNEKSRNAILRIGAKHEGILRRHMLTWDGRFRDTVYFSILDSEWPGVKRDLEHKLRTPC